MEKEKIVDIFLKRGLMIDQDSLDYFSRNPEQVKIFLEKIVKMEVPPVVKIDLIKSILEEVEIKEIKKKALNVKNFSVDDISRILLERYEKIKSFFSYRMDIVNLISINKITEKTKKFSLIVMVRDINKENKSAVVEDFTGEISVFFKNNFFGQIVQDEVVGLVCEKTNDKIEVTNVLWPDVPLRRKVANLEEDVYCFFILGKWIKEYEKKILEEISKINYKKLIFLFVESYEKKQIEELKEKLPINTKLILITKEKLELEDVTSFSPPAFLLINGKVNLLLCDGKMFSPYKNILGERTEEIMLNLLKKRHLNPIFTIERVLEEDCFLIEPVPDIFLSFDFGTSGLINYKGTTIISSGSSERIFWIVNLKTRENLKIDLI
ncbi:MAG: hypothetical protein QW040_00740 [Candidatus Aenigmatarchaeota archaeon]